MQVTRPAAVVVLAAGAGTRMKSVVPKVLHKMCGRSLLGHAIAAARGLDPEHLVVVVRHQRDAVIVIGSCATSTIVRTKAPLAAS